MKMDKVAGSGNDEFYTPKYAIEPILKYIPRGSKVWCPFDTESSLFYKLLKDHGCDVKVSHLESGIDFLAHEETKSFEIMYLNKRVAYFKDYADEKPSLNPPFSSVYVCSSLLPTQIVFETVEK